MSLNFEIVSKGDFSAATHQFRQKMIKQVKLENHEEVIIVCSMGFG